MSPDVFSAAPELALEKKLRSVPGLIPLATLCVAVVLYAALALTAQLFAAGQLWIAALSGLLVHAFMLVVVHEGAHRAITGTRLDRVLMNVGAGLVLLPFWAEPFRRFHLIHHARTNVPDDPLWPASKRRLYRDHRGLYIVAELIPLLFSILAIVGPAEAVPSVARAPRLSVALLALSFAVAGATAWLLAPQWTFLLATLLWTNAWGALRHVCEHFGFDDRIESNTFAFPLGFGIGNHAVHHAAPRLSWLTLALGLWRRPKQSGPLRAAFWLLTRRDFHHYQNDQNDQNDQGIAHANRLPPGQVQVTALSKIPEPIAQVVRG